MLVLFETAAGFALFKVLDEGKVNQVDDLQKEFSSADTARKISGKINKVIRDEALRDLGQVEQDLVFGEAATKEVINFLRANQDTKSEYKLRL